ncbi:MAG: hypothetical protein FJ020_07055 [Chloroflexi bacterium]|nr:hypothetical protein [Chloroflexota bacterium]
MNDGLGGTVIAWRGIGIQAQKLDDFGKRQWADDGAHVARADFPVMTADGLGGTIVVWHSSGDLYAQRLGSDGMLQWATDGVAVYTGGEQRLHPVLVSDGYGGAIIAWYDGSTGRGEDNRVYGQRLDAEGVPQWTANGEVICSVPGDQRDLAIASDGSAGAIIAWNDKRSPDGGVYAQRLNSAGELQWDAEGALIRRDAHSQPVIVGDGFGGAIITLATGSDLSESEISDIYAQRLDSDGSPQWAPGGVAVCTAPNNQIEPVAVSDGSGGVIIAWQDGRVATDTDRQDELWDWGHASILHNDDIYAQRLDSGGNPQWTSDGVAVCTAPHLQRGLQMVANGSGGAVIAWADFRDYPLEGMRTDLGYIFDWYAQGVDGSGSLGPASGGRDLPVLIVVVVALGAVCVVAAGTLVWKRRGAQAAAKAAG